MHRWSKLSLTVLRVSMVWVKLGGPTNGLVTGYMVRGGTSVVIATRENVMTKCGIIPVPAPLLVIIGLVARNSGLLHLALTRGAGGCAQG
jgi:hypothetical protein